MELFRKAAEQGDAKAQSNLGQMYARGRGVERNLAFAYKWLRLSVEQNEITAQKALHEVEPEMSPEQIAEGERLAREFRDRTGQR
ncbi:MAG TPA: tetratricopeptide repeat protein [Chthoniobacterales bacterium]|nr:tetratricopeptide repeat protein [Chthoniobacterales bacterium]